MLCQQNIDPRNMREIIVEMVVFEADRHMNIFAFTHLPRVARLA